MIKQIFNRLIATNQQETQLNNEEVQLQSCYDCNLYTALFNQHPDGVILFNTDGKVVDCNEKISSIFGYSLQELQDDFFRYVDDDSIKNVLRNFKKALKGKTREYTSVRIKNDGTKFYVKSTLTPIIVDDVVKGVVGIFRDNNEYINIKEHLKRAQQIAKVGSWDYYPNEEIVFWSDEVYSIFGIKHKSSFAPTLGKFMNMIYHEDREMFKQVFEHALQDRQGYELEFRIMRLGGEIRSCMAKADLTVDNAGNVLKITGVIQDITEKKERENLIYQKESQLLNIIQTIDSAVWSVDIKNNKLLYCSEGVYKVFGASSEEFLDSADYWKKFIHPADIQSVEKTQQDLLVGKSLHHQYRIIDGYGTIKWIEDTTFPTLDMNGKLVRLDGTITDITEQKTYQEKLEHIANHDYLTELPNRRYFERKLNETLEVANRNKQMLSILLLDLDRFKTINDALGHAVGDNLLVEVAHRLSEASDNSTFIARVGGDEFCLLIENITGMDAGIALSHRILKKFEQPFLIDGYELYVTASIGVTYAPYNGDDAITLLKNVDIAMYRAKESGRNDYYVYTPSMNVETFKRYSLEKGLHTALKNNEFDIEYQPKINPKTGKMESAEALLRWNHPEWGMVSPSEFIPLAEESDMILSIGDWVLKQVCEKIKYWQENGYNIVPIAINISYKRFIKKDFLESVVRIVKETGIHPSLIEFEITERTMIQNEEIAKVVLTKMQALGFKFALDDFGTCQSSLSYLSTFEIDVIKIDRSFIQEIGLNKRIESIISTIISLAENLGIKIVAEGVETEEQLQFLREKNCHLIQGYLYSKSVEANEFEQFLKSPNFNSEGQHIDTHFEGFERRAHYRVNLEKPIVGNMTITEIKQRPVNMGYSKILIQNISRGGLAFLSQINLPLNEDISLKFTFKLGEQTVSLLGIISWKKEEGDVYFYGVKFQDKLTNQHYINHLVAQFKNKSSKQHPDFISYSGTAVDFFKGTGKEN